MNKKEIEKYIDDYIDMGCFVRPEEAKPYLMDGFDLGYREAIETTKKRLKSIGFANVDVFFNKECK